MEKDRPAFRILIIDDNPAIHQDFEKILIKNNDTNGFEQLDEQFFGKKSSVEIANLAKIEICTALQGEEGVELVKEALNEEKTFSLAFVDIRMPPGWDGIETIKHLWEVDPNIQVVICSAYSDYSWEKTIEELGVRDNLLILKKPFDVIAVRQLACALTKKWQLMQENLEHINSMEKRIQKRTYSLRNSLAQIKATLEASADGILIVDSTGHITDYNTKFAELWGVPEDILQERQATTLFDYLLKQVTDPEMLSVKYKQVAAKEDFVDISTIKLKNESVIEQFTQPYKLKAKTGGRVWSFRDITQRVRLEEKLEFEATHDALTGLPNRVLLHERIEQAILSANRNQTLMSVMFLDLDRFKLINDSLGHSAGDELLHKLANRLRKSLRASDTLSRLGGDEFVILMTDIDSPNRIINLASSILDMLKQPFTIAEEHEVITTASMGISLYPQDGQNADELLRNADLAMYHAKEMSADRFCFYKQELNAKSLLRLSLENELRMALKNDEFFVIYQPQFDITSQEMIAVEAIIRWQHPTKGVILPMDFIPLAEDMGLMIPIGEWLLETACKQNKTWQEQGLKPIRVSVNITNTQINQPDFIGYLSDLLKQTGLAPEFLELELTESMLVNNVESLKLIHGARKLGVQITLDDFGTGASGLSYLRKLSIDRLKIDKSYIDSIGDDKNDESLIKAIINMAISLNLGVIAEGVETEKQMSFLESSDCRVVQGFFIGNPVTHTDIETVLRST